MSEKKPIQAQDVMLTEFDRVDGIATIAEALQGAKHLENQCMIVNRRDENDEFGILLLADIAKQVLAKDKSPHRVNVYEIMSKPVIGVSPQMDIRYCSRLFNKFGMNVAPVIKDNDVIGLVSYKHIVMDGLMQMINAGEK